MNVAIITWGDESRILYDLLHRNGYNIVCIIEDNNCKWDLRYKETPIVSSGKGAVMFEAGSIEKFIVPSLDEQLNYRAEKMISAYGIDLDNLLYAPIETLKGKLSDGEKIAKICLYTERTELETMEIHVAEHCNLNCKNCSMFCGLVETCDFPCYQEFEEGIKQLKNFFPHIKKFRIIGGEPLLNPELDKYICLIRNVYPYTDIRLISNGILVTKMSDQLIQTIRVCILAYYLACIKEFPLEIIRDVLEIAKYHDIGRINDGKDENHGLRGAILYSQYFRNTSEKSNVYGAIITAHSLRDEVFEKVWLEWTNSMDNINYGKMLLGIIKDADALDRFRLRDCSLRTEFLHNKESLHLVRAAYELYHLYD